MTVDLTKRPTYSPDDVEAMTRAYLVCALWSSTDDDGEPLDQDHDTDDLSPETEAGAVEDVVNFLEYVGSLLSGIDPGQAGHDFWLTRNGHGAGFWDRGLGRRGEQLSTAARTFGSVDLYVGDDGLIYGT